MKETAFEFLPLHLVMVPMPIAPEKEVVLVSGGLNTNTSTIPGSAMSAAVIVRFQLVSTNERRHPEGTVPTHQGVATKVVAIDRQYELIACGGCVIG